MLGNRKKGTEGELEAINVLTKRGFLILETNFRGTYGEIDIIAKDGEDIIFIEVKKRTNFEKGLPREAVTIRKQKKIQSAALEYIESKGLDSFNFRFDVVEIMDNKGKLYYNHIRNAFWE